MVQSKTTSGKSDKPAVTGAPAEKAATAAISKPTKVAKPLVRKAPAKTPAKPVAASTAKAEPVKATAVKAEPVKAEPVKAEPVKAEPVKAEPVKAEPVKAEPVKAEPTAPAIAKPIIEPVSGPAVAPAPAMQTAPEPVVAPAAPAAEHTVQTTISNWKENFMTNDFTANIADTMTEATTEVQARMQQAFDKSSGMVTEMTELAKGNVEAVVESSKLLAAGVQDMGKSYAEEAKSAYETMTADMKEMAAIKSPTELFQLQGKIMRRNFDMMIAATSKSTDATLKLMNEAIAPISGRVNVTAEKLSQVA